MYYTVYIYIYTVYTHVHHYYVFTAYFSILDDIFHYILSSRYGLRTSMGWGRCRAHNLTGQEGYPIMVRCEMVWESHGKS